jgi:hypothetical protein
MFSVSNIKSSTIIAKMKTLFARNGVPEVVISDNDPQHSSGGFAEFAEMCGFKPVTSSPLYPQSNGLSRKNCSNSEVNSNESSKRSLGSKFSYIGTSKYANQRCWIAGKIEYGKNTSVSMPSSTDQLLPKTVNPAIVQTRLEQKQALQKSTVTDHRDTWNIFLKAMTFRFSAREDVNLLLSRARLKLQEVSIL